MSLRMLSIGVALTVTASGLATGPRAEAQQAGGRLYPAHRGERFDDWTVQAFRDLDEDGNGRITAAEWSYDREDFRRADHNRDGVLTRREFLGEADADGDRADTDRGDASSADDQRFLDLDGNRDDRVSRGEWRGDRASFDRLDENRDGYLTRAEMAARDATDDDFSRLDSDRNGIISRGEWLQSAARFERLDTNHDGRLTATEYAAARRDGVTTSTGPASPGTATQNAAYRAGYARGTADGRAAGREDRERNQGFDLDGQRELETADAGYDARDGSRADFQAGYRAAFRVAYREGYGRN